MDQNHEGRLCLIPYSVTCDAECLEEAGPLGPWGPSGWWGVFRNVDSSSEGRNRLRPPTEPEARSGRRLRLQLWMRRRGGGGVSGEEVRKAPSRDILVLSVLAAWPLRGCGSGCRWEGFGGCEGLIRIASELPKHQVTGEKEGLELSSSHIGRKRSFPGSFENKIHDLIFSGGGRGGAR